MLGLVVIGGPLNKSGQIGSVASVLGRRFIDDVLLDRSQNGLVIEQISLGGTPRPGIELGENIDAIATDGFHLLQAVNAEVGQVVVGCKINHYSPGFSGWHIVPSLLGYWIHNKTECHR